MTEPVEKEPQALTAKQKQAALLLASGCQIAAAARSVGVDERTIDRWKKIPEFKEAQRTAEDELYAESLSLLKLYAKDAIECLIRNMTEAAPYVQVQAASKILDAGLQVTKIQELEALLAQLEARLQE